MLYLFLQTIQKPSDLALKLAVLLCLLALACLFLLKLLLDLLSHELLLVLFLLDLSFSVDCPSFESFFEQHEAVELFSELQ